MNTLEIDEQKAIELYPEASASLKKLLEEKFTVAVLTDVTNKLQAQYEAACKKLNVDNTIPNFSTSPERMRAHLIAGHKLEIMYQARVKGNKPCLTDGSYKAYPWGEICKDPNHPSGFGFSVSSYGNANTAANVGSRFAFKTGAEATEFMRENMPLIQDFQFIPEM